ncbi:MAG: SPOR domain-containing protein [Proteobacteria bacterium]|nr:SPOR domain-containing protein [Pseudomonadota bacterium]
MAQVDLRQAKETFLIQIASFRNRQDAEKLKASLILKGFDVNVAMATQNQANWYRVIVGPFASRNDAMKTQNILARNERIQGMIRKVG